MISCVSISSLCPTLTRFQVEMIRAQAGALKGAPVDQIVRVSGNMAMVMVVRTDIQVEERKKKAEAEVV